MGIIREKIEDCVARAQGQPNVAAIAICLVLLEEGAVKMDEAFKDDEEVQLAFAKLLAS